MLRSACFLLTFALSTLFAGPTAEEWASITKLDAGPTAVPKNESDAKRIAIAHNELQEKTLRAFVAAHPKDANFFEAKLRLARTLSIHSRLNGEPEPGEIGRILTELDAVAVGPQLAELDFARLSREMRRLQGSRPSPGQRAALLESARKFQKGYPTDRRIASLLAEVATLFEHDPKTKTALISDAEKLAQDPNLKAQLADDRKRLNLLDKPLGLRFTGIDGANFDIKTQRGKVVVVLFFATWSEPSMAAFSELRDIMAKNDDAVFVGVSLDKDKATLQGFLRQLKRRPIVGWDGKIWDSPLIQTTGINTLPTVWIFDKQGLLRSLDGLEETEKQITRLGQE